MTTSEMDMTPSDVQTFRGMSLEEVLPQVRETLGPDAVVLRRREGLVGGVAGFFQRPFVEVDARKPLPDEVDPVPRNDRATEEGLSSPVVRALVEQASPFADALARAERGIGTRAEEFLASEAVDAGLRGAPRRAGGGVPAVGGGRRRPLRAAAEPRGRGAVARRGARLRARRAGPGR